jgi:Ran GTPase-activating protein (RanGAP) involved in mRNA processing and transport
MIALLHALKTNAGTLREVYLHDNWIKGEEANDRLVKFILRAEKLERLNVSDSTMGLKPALLLIRALVQSKCSKTLKYFACNYNEIESSRASKQILDTLLDDEVFKALETIEFRGNSLGGRKVGLEYMKKFEDQNRKLLVFEDDDEGDEDDEGEEDDDGEEIDGDLTKKLEDLKL